MDFMSIVYIVLWGLLALYCYCMAHKISPVLYLAGVFFTFMFGWNLADKLIAVDLFSGMYGWIYKGVAVVFLVAILIFYMIIRRNSSNEK